MSTDIKDQIRDRVTYLVLEARKIFPGLKMSVPHIVFTTPHRRINGIARKNARTGEMEIGFNLQNLDKFGMQQFRNTISHEVAHCVVWAMGIVEEDSHGNAFQHVHKALGGTGEARSSYTFAAAERNGHIRMDREYYYCRCPGHHAMTKGEHQKILDGATFTCNRCRTVIYQKKAA